MGVCETKYKIREGYIHRKAAGNDVLISVGENVANFNGYITLNPAAAGKAVRQSLFIKKQVSR